MSEIQEWERVREAFLDLIECAPDERSEHLARLRESQPTLAERVAELLAHDHEEDAQTTPTPKRLGPYEVLRPIGSGGMGEVFIARRADGEYEREVAVKLLRPGFAEGELVQRFLRERQTLARLDHEYIARLLGRRDNAENGDALPGASSTCEGQHIDDYCRERDLPHPTSACELFVQASLEAVAVRPRARGRSTATSSPATS